MWVGLGWILGICKWEWYEKWNEIEGIKGREKGDGGSEQMAPTLSTPFRPLVIRRLGHSSFQNHPQKWSLVTSSTPRLSHRLHPLSSFISSMTTRASSNPPPSNPTKTVWARLSVHLLPHHDSQFYKWVFDYLLGFFRLGWWWRDGFRGFSTGTGRLRTPPSWGWRVGFEIGGMAPLRLSFLGLPIRFKRWSSAAAVVHPTPWLLGSRLSLAAMIRGLVFSANPPFDSSVCTICAFLPIMFFISLDTFVMHFVNKQYLE